MKSTGTICAFLLVLVSVVTARTTTQSNPCSLTCNREDQLFKTGKTYIYSYEGESNVNTEKGLYDTTGILIKSKVKITGLSNCEMKLSMFDVQVFDKSTKDGQNFQESPNSGKVKKLLEQNEVFFTRDESKVKSICMDREEPIWSENIKKVIIDSIANQGIQTLDNKPQLTSHGNCYIQKMAQSSPNTVKFEYNLGSCINDKMPTSIFTDITQATLFDKSSVSCQYEYQGADNLKNIQCTETYQMIPLRKDANRIEVQVQTRLTKISETKSTDETFSNKNLIKTGIEQSQDELHHDESTYSSVKLLLKEICAQQVASTSSLIPKLFMKLINQLKDLNSKEFKEIYVDVLKTDICTEQQSEIRSIFYDAVSFVNTPASTSVMVDLIKANQLSSFDQNVWLSSLSFMQQTPTIDMLKDLDSLISTDKPTSPMFLGISSVTHLYCKTNYESCQSDPVVKSIISKFLTNLNNDCSPPKDSSSDYLSKVQISLKALGNLKFFSDQVTDVLKKCVSTKTNPLSIRISALQVMKHMGCQKDRSVAMEILENNENDSELRINAYLTVMGCSDINTIFKVRKILEKEEANQVGSFIWTHLTNIKESRDAVKAGVKELLDNVELKKVFDISKLKFSRNIEKTFRADTYAMTFDSNIIFSEKSFVPRSVSLNTTATIFDRPTNFLEMNARLEGLEELLYKMFGPEGYMKKQTSVEDSLALINMLNEMNGNMDIKLYGQQISFIELIRGSLGSVKKYNILEEIMNWSQNKQFELNKNIQLIDKTAVIPTMLGFPLQLKLQGSVSMNIKIKSKLDIDGLFNWPIAFNIDNHISPNINAELNADLILQAPFSKYGMRLNLKSGTNTEFKAKIFASQNEEFSIKFDTPKIKQEIISVEGSTYVIHRSQKIVQLADKMKQNELCTPELVTRLLGVKLCGMTRFVDPAIKKNTLFYGPFAASVYIEKQDSQTGYLIRGSSKSVSYIDSESGQRYMNRFIKFEIDTPNSQAYNRRFFGEFVLDFQAKHIKLELSTPWNQVLLMTNFKFASDEKRVRFNFQVDKNDIVDVMVNHAGFSTQKGHTSKCAITVALWKLIPIKTKWSLETSNEKFVFNFNSKGLMKDDALMKIEVTKIKSTRELSLFNKYEVNGHYSSYFGRGKISGIASENYYGHRWDVRLNHKPKNTNEKEFVFVFRHKTEDKSSKNLNKYILTTTFAYGEKAENILKLKTENELSDKHIRTSLKIGSGKNTESVIDFVDLQLYGGYRWKEDNRHYAEGSLSVKLPTRNLNYEGRYNSEVGKRIFKLSLALDQDQQSKVNLKINYAQPKLYLKNTDLEVAFSIPKSNIDMKWNLVEVDVNRYQYVLDSKYNNYQIRVDGVQTQISKLNHDSSVTIKMTNIESLPKQVNVNCKISLVDLAKSSIQVKIEIPNSNYRYSIDTKFSYLPENLLQISSSDTKSVIKSEIELSSFTRTMKSKFIFTCNPEEFQTYFNLNLDNDKDPANQIEFDIHGFHKNPNYKQYDNFGRITLTYPGNSHSIGFKSEFKYKEMMSQLDFTWNKNQKILINTMYEIDDSWTRKGLTSSLTIRTPFKGLEQIHFGINGIAELRYRKLDFECKWGSNKKIMFDIVIYPKSSNDFSLTWKLVTPFQGWNLISFQLKHMYTQQSINSQASLEIGTKNRYEIKFEGANNSEGKNRDYLANILIESGVYPAFQIAFLHKDDGVHFKTKFDVKGMKIESINVNSDVSFTFEDSELITKGSVELLSTLKKLKPIKIAWAIDNRGGQLSNDIEIQHNSKQLFKSSIKGFYELEPGKFKMEFNGVVTALNTRSITVASNLNYQDLFDFQHQFSLSQDKATLYSHNFVTQPKTVVLKFLIPTTEFKTINIEYIKNNAENLIKSEGFVKIGEKYLLKLDETIAQKQRKDNLQIDNDFTVKFYSDFLEIKEFETTGKVTIDRHYLKLQMTGISSSMKMFELNGEIDWQTTGQKFHLNFKSQYQTVNQLNLVYENFPTDPSKPFVKKFDINLNEAFKFNSKITVQNFHFIDMEFNLKYRNVFKFLKLKHSYNPVNYEHVFDTNVFGKRIKLTSSIQLKSGLTMKLKMNGDFRYLKSLEFYARHSKSGEIMLVYRTQKDSKTDNKFRIGYSSVGHEYKLNVDASSYFQTEIKLDLNKLKTILFEVKTSSTTKPIFKIEFNYKIAKDPFKHESELKFNIGDKEFQLRNRLENVKWKYLKIESQMESTFHRLANYQVKFEYQLKPSKFIVNVDANAHNQFIKLIANIDSSSESKMELKLETSFPVLKEIAFELKHRQNNLYTQMFHQCKLTVRSYDSLLKSDHNIEWIGANYIKIDLSLSGKSSESSYFIQPKSLKFIHNFYKNKLEEDWQIILSADLNLKTRLIVPLQAKSKSSFELETSFEKLKKLVIGLDVNFLENDEKSMLLRIRKDLENLFVWESKYRNQNKFRSISSNIELNDNYKTGFDIDLSERAFGTTILTGKFNNPSLKEPIVVNAKYESPKRDLTITITGDVVEKISLNIRISKFQYNFKVKYGTKLFHVNLVSNSDEGLHLFKLISSTVIDANFELMKTSNLYKIAGKFGKNSFKAIAYQKGEIKLNVDILNRKLDVTMKREAKQYHHNYEIEGKTNLKGWNEFKSVLEMTQDKTHRQMKIFFNKESQRTIDIQAKQQISKSIDIRFSFDYVDLKSGKFEMNYEDFPMKLSLEAEANIFGKQPLKLDYKLEGNTFKGEVTSPFEWIRKINLSGELTIKNDEMKGSFSINHNRLEQSITGEFYLQMKTNLFKIEMKTPFSYPYNEISFKREMSKTEYSIEMSNKQNKLLSYKFKKLSDSEYQAELNIIMTRQTKDYTFNLLSQVSFQADKYSFKLTTKSSLFEEVNLEIILNKLDYLIKFSNSYKEGQVQLTVVPYKSSGRKIQAIVQYGESKHDVDITYEIKNLNEIFFSSVAKSSFFSSSSGLEAYYTHALMFPNRFNLDTQWKFNDKTIFYKSINWQKQDDNSFDLISKTILSPNDKEYETKIQLSSKRGEIFNFIMTATDILAEPIDIRIGTKLDNWEFSLQSPFEMAKSILFNVRREYQPKFWTQTITLETNKLGKYKLLTEYRVLLNDEVQLNFQIDSPSTNKQVYSQINFKNHNDQQSFNGQLELNGQMYTANLVRQRQEIQMKFNTPFECVKKFEFTVKDNVQSYEIEVFYNDNRVKAISTINHETIDIKIESNIVNFRDISLVVQKSQINQMKTSVNVKLTRDGQQFQLNFEIDKEHNSLQYSSHNSLLPFLPKSFSGKYQHSFRPINFQVEFKSNDVAFFQIIVNDEQILFNSKMKVFKTTIKELKLSATKSRMEFILVTNDVFSILITRTPENQIDAAVIMSGNEYSMRINFENNSDKVLFKLSTYKNAVDKLLEINNEIGKREAFIDFDVTYQSKSILKLKLTNKSSPTQKMSLETRLLSFNGVADVTFDRKPSLMNLQISWNVLYSDQQLTVGSISYVWKSSRPLNYAMSINLHDMAFQVQLIESDNGQFRLQASSPFKGVDIDIKWLLTKESDMYNFWCSIDNSLTGEYSIKITMRTRKDPEFKFLFSSNIPIVKMKFNLITSVANEMTFNSELRPFDWEKISFNGKLSTKELIELVVALNSPFKVARNIQVEKTIKFISILEHQYTTKIIYEGITTVKYLGSHEIDWKRKIIKFQTSFHKDDLKIVSLDINHSGDHDKLDHSIVWNFKDQKFGMKMNGGFKPLFEGRSEIITPFHQAGKIVLMGKQMENGVLIEVEKDKQLASFEYMKEKNVRLIKLTPPTQYGKIVGVKFETRRFKRSLDSEIKTEMTYGTGKVFEWYSKIQMDKDKYSADLKLKSPSLSNKSIRLSLNHEFNDKTMSFDHKFTVKDVVENVYRLFGKMVRDNSKHLKIDLNSEHPEYGLINLAFGHSLTDNNYNSHFSLKSADKTIMMHNGDIKFDFEKPSLDGVWNMRLNDHHHKWAASHSGDWNDFVQALVWEYNNTPYLRYNSQVRRQEKSEIVIEIPTVDGAQIKIIVDRKENKLDLSWKNKFHNYLIETTNKNGNLHLSYKANDETITTLSIGYGKQPFNIKGSYLKDSGSLEVSWNQDWATLKMESTFTKLTRATLKISKNSLTTEGIYNNKPFSVNTKYSYSSDSAYITMETSVKALSKFEFHISSKQCKLIFNEFFQTLQYTLKPNHIQLIGNNNFMLVKKVLLDLQWETSSKAILTVQFDSFSLRSKIEYSNDKFLFELDNNYHPLHSIQFQVERQIRNDRHEVTVKLSTNGKQTFRVQWEIRDSQYDLRVETYSGHHLMASYNVPKKEMKIELNSGTQFLKITNHITDSDSITMETYVSSSLPYLKDLRNEFVYSTRDSSYQIQQSLTYNNRLNLRLQGEFSNSKVHAYINLDKIVYSATILVTSKNNLDLRFIAPRHDTIIRLRREANKFSADVEWNQKQIFNAVVKQSLELKDNFNHESIIYYRETMIWNFNFNTDFRKYQVKMISPVKMSATITNDWNEKEMTSLGFHVKYDCYRKPMEIGAGIKFQITKDLITSQVHMENTYHVISWKRSFSTVDGKQVTLGLLNKQTNNQWEVTVKSTKDNFEFQWKSPTSNYDIKYKQIVENNIRTSVDLDVFSVFKFNIKSNPNSPNLWSGSMTLFTTKIASVEIGKDYISGIFNDAGNENEKIRFKWTCSTQGEWKKNYLSVKQLILIQKSLNIDLNIVQKTRMERSVYSRSMTVNYQLINGTMRTLKFGASIDFSKSNTIVLELENPIIPIKTVLTRVQPDSTNLRYEMETRFNENDKISGFFLLSTGSNPGITMRLYQNPRDREEFVEFHSKYIDDRQMETHIFHEKDSKKTTYFLVLLRLLNEHHIETTFEWKTFVFYEIRAALNKMETQMRYKINRFIKNEWHLMTVSDRLEQLRGIIPNSQTLVFKLKELETQFQIEWRSLHVELENIYTRDEFFYRTIYGKISEILDSTFRFVETAVDRAISRISQLQVKITRIIQAVIDFSFKVYHTIYPNISIILAPIQFKVKYYARWICLRLNLDIIHSLENIQSFIDRQIANIVQVTINVKKLVKVLIFKQASIVVNRTLQIIKYIVAQFPSDSLDFLKQEETVKTMYKNLIEKLEKLSERLSQQLQLIFIQADDHVSFLTGEKYFSMMGKELSSMLKYAIEQLKDVRYEEMVMTFIRSSISDTFADLESKIQEITVDLVWPYVALFDMSKNQRLGNVNDFRMVVRYTSPIPMNDLKSFPNFGFVTKKIQRIKHYVRAFSALMTKRSLARKLHADLKDWFIPSFPQISLPSILPEFESYATISKTSVVTFDKRIIQLKSDSCQVLLSKDNRNKKWEIILNQQKDSRSYKINIGSNSIEISGTDYKVQLNGKPAELPLEIGSTQLVGLGRVMKLTDDILGLTITVDPMNEMLTVGISGWYHAKVRGLFGNNDNEPFNDLMLDDGKIVDSKTFMKTYNYNGATCQVVPPKVKNPKLMKHCPFMRKVVCKFIYQFPFSPLGSCFKTVDTTNFLNMCMDSVDSLSKLDPAICQSARQYQEQCSHAGVQVAVPLPCQKCNVKNGKPLSVNEFQTKKIKEKASDIIFVVDKGDCLKSIEPQLSNVVQTLEKEMHSKSITSVKFGLVTYADENDSEANFHTVGQKILGSSEEVIKSIRAIKPSNGKFRDVSGALLLASNYPFRAHASRHIVMISCRSTTELSTRLDTISDKLQQRAIHLSLLTDFSFQLKESNEKAIILGVDSKNSYSPLYKTNYKKFTTPENDLLYKLTMKLEGLVFDYKFLTSNPELSQKSFVNVFARQMIQRSTPARSTKCTCIGDGEYRCVPLDFHTIFPVTKVA